MTPEQFARFRAGRLLCQSFGMAGDTLHVTEVRRDRETGLVVRATFFAETMLTLAPNASK